MSIYHMGYPLYLVLYLVFIWTFQQLWMVDISYLHFADGETVSLVT